MASIITFPTNCTFIHIPKTGGNSITKWMTDNFSTKITKRKQHATVDECLEGNHSLGPMTKDSLGFKFCVVRNPWDYMVSWYTFKVMLCKSYIKIVQENPELSNNRKEKYNIILQQKKLENLNKGFDWWVRQTDRYPQYHWAKDCDYVLKLENINDDFKMIQEKLNCFVPLGHLNKTSNRTSYQNYYTQETINVVAEKYSIDIKTFGYEF